MKLFFILGCVFIFFQCNNSKKLSKNKYQKELIAKWEVIAFRFHDGRVMPGEYMGYPCYEFTENGYRVKTLNEKPSPPPDSIRFAIKGDSIWYPEKPKFPAMKIVKLKADTLVLSNDKLSWYLSK